MPAPQFKMDAIAGPQQRKQFSDLLDRSFQVPPGRRFFDDFPIWDESLVPTGPRITRLGVFAEDGTLVASAGVRITRLAPLMTRQGLRPAENVMTRQGLRPAENVMTRQGLRPAENVMMGEPLIVGLIGAVATDEKHRGSGFATELVSLASQWAATREAAALFLWGSEHSLYQKLGFELCGRQSIVPLKDMKLVSGKQVSDLNTGWNPALMPLLMKRSGGMILTEEDARWMGAHKNVQWYWTGKRDAPTSYAAVGRGIDLSGIVHEHSAGSRELLSGLVVRQPDLKILGNPESLKSLGAPDQAPVENLCLSKVLSPARVIRWAHPDFETPIEPEGEGFRLGGASGTWSSEREWSRALFGSPGVKLTQSILPQLLPLPLWIWGLDAV